MADKTKVYTNVVDVAGAQWSAQSYDVDPADGVTMITNADPNRRAVTIFTDPNSVGVLYLVPNAGQSTGGIRLVPGSGFEFGHAAAIYGRAVGGLVTVNVVNESGAVC